MFCPGCGNEIEDGQECPICETRRERRRARDDVGDSRLCTRCGNTIYGSDPCPICNSDRAPRRRVEAKPERTLCTRCGNEMDFGGDCPICASGRGGKRRRKPTVTLVLCISCRIPMREQDWDGVAVRVCSSCQGMLFPPNALERVLDKLRDAAEAIDYSEVLREFKDRHKAQRAMKSVKYKHCPVCDELMVRRNYAGASGIVLDVCGDHGHWVDQNSFADLSDWISRGGDQLAARKRHP